MNSQLEECKKLESTAMSYPPPRFLPRNLARYFVDSEVSYDLENSCAQMRRQ